MNCQDIARILDEQEVDRLLATEHSAVQAHLANCAECARDWQIHARLSGVEIPAVPAELRALYAGRVTGLVDAGARRRSRFIAMGTLVVVAAAAAMLAVQLGGSTRQVAAIVDPPEAESVVEPVSDEAIKAAPDESAGQHERTVEQNAVVEEAKPAPLRIVMMPTRYDSSDKTAKPAIDAFHFSLLKALRNTPGVIVDVAGIADSADDHPENRVTVVSPRFTTLSSGERVYHSGDGERIWSMGIGSAPRARDPPKWYVEVMLEPAAKTGPDSHSAVSHYIDGNGVPKGGSCSARGKIGILNIESRGIPNAGGRESANGPPTICSSVESLAARIVAALSPRAEPPASDAAQLASRLADASGSIRDRDTAYSEVLRRARQGAVVLDATTLDAIIAYVGSLPPDKREQCLVGMRGVRQPGLVVPLLAFLQQDGEEKVRLEALSVLVKDYISESRVRTVLETVARQDASQLVRMVAHRTLSGDAQWEPYVVATLLDKSLRVTERLAPAQYDAGLANYPEGFEKMQSYLGSEEVTKQLLDIFQQLRSRNQTRQPEVSGFPGGQGVPPGFGSIGRSQQSQEEEIRVVSLLSITNPSAAIDLQIRILTEDSGLNPGQLASYALRNLLDKRRRDDPHVIKALDEIAAGKSGPGLRNQLERSLAER